MESPIEAILYCEFDSRAGPVIVHQVPNNYVTKEQFDSLSIYLIPKPELERRLLTINALNLKVIGYPMGIDHSRYSRNRLMFNVCFFCLPNKRTFTYEPIVKKLNCYFEDLELECQFLSDPQKRIEIPKILENIRVHLNEHKVCKIEMTPSTTINLKMVSVHPDPEEAHEELVPVLLVTKSNFIPSRWDLTTQQVIPYIDGYRHIARISTEADVEYSNCYLPTQKLIELYQSEKLRTECIEYVSRSNNTTQDCLPKFRAVFKIFCSMNYGITMRDLCLQYNPSNLNIDEKKLIRFGLMKGFIRKIHRFPIFLATNNDELNCDKSSLPASSKAVADLFDGSHNFDQICCKASKSNISVKELLDDVERREEIILINK